jgi:hypothetical protein
MDSPGRRRRLELSPSVLVSDAIDSSDRFNHDIRFETFFFSVGVACIFKKHMTMAQECHVLVHPSLFTWLQVYPGPAAIY